MSFILSPNMNLPVPVVGQEPGPQYAQDVNNALTLIDEHDHTPGNGVQITPAGMNINANLSFQSNFLTNAAGVNFTAQSLTPGISTVYESGVDLYYVDGLGNNIQITANGGIAGSPGSISNLVSPASAAYVAGTSTFVWESNTNTAANMDFGSAILRNLTPNSTFGLTLSPPAALSSNYTITLPTLPSVLSFMTIDNAGTVTTNPFAITSKGDLIVGTSGGSSARLGVGADGLAVVADSTATNGLSYRSAASSNISTKTGNYTLTGSDGTIIANANGSNITLTLPAASSFPNQKYTIRRVDLSYVAANNVTISGTISGESDWVLHTQNETIEIQSNGTSWNLLRHDTINPTVQDNTPVLSTGSFGTTTTKVWNWHREGQYMVGQLLVVQTVGGTGGSGDYRLTVPSGFSIDTALAPASTTSNAFTAVSTTSLPSTCIVLANVANIPQISGPMCVYDSTHVRIIGIEINDNTATPVSGATTWSSSSIGLGNAPLNITASFRMPISGWKP